MKSIIHKFVFFAIFSGVAIMLFFAVACSATSNAGSENPNSRNKAEISVSDRFNDSFVAHTRMLHDRLGITPLQEILWNNVTLVMLENSLAMAAIIQSRAGKETSMTALDDIKSYSEVASIHADGLKKFLPAFEALYMSMSEEQQKNASILFQNQRKKMSINKKVSKAPAN